MGENDAVALAEGAQTSAAISNYVTTVENNVINELTALLGSIPSTDHLIVATVPDVFDTPEIQGLTALTSANILADRSAIQQANADITAFALSKNIPVVDLYGMYDALLTKPLTLGSATFTTNQLFATGGLNPAPIAEGLIANMVVDAIDLGYAAGIPPLTEQQLVTNAGGTDTVTGSTYLNLSPYVVVNTTTGMPTTTITATLLSPNGQPTTSTHDVLVNLSLGGGTLGSQTTPPDFFISGEYYTPGNTTWEPAILIHAGQTSGSITLNGLGELANVIEVTARTSTGGTTEVEGGVELTPQQVTATLSTKAVSDIVSLSENTSLFSETGGTITVTASLPAGQTATHNIVVTLSFGGTATEGTDYLATGNTIVIPEGQQSASITLVGTGSPIAVNESVVVTMTALDGQALIAENGVYGQTPQQVVATLTPGGTATGTIEGTVTDVNNNPLSGVIIYLYPASSGGPTTPPPGTSTFNPAVNYFTTTNATGAYSFTGLAPGNYDIARADSAELHRHHDVHRNDPRQRRGGRAGVVVDTANAKLHQHGGAAGQHGPVGRL